MQEYASLARARAGKASPIERQGGLLFERRYTVVYQTKNVNFAKIGHCERSRTRTASHYQKNPIISLTVITAISPSNKIRPTA